MVKHLPHIPVLLGSISSTEKQRDQGGREREDRGIFNAGSCLEKTVVWMLMAPSSSHLPRKGQADRQAAYGIS